MRYNKLLAAVAIAASAVACSDEPSAPQNGDTITLSVAQSNSIQNRVEQIAPLHPELAWLADTIAIIASAGAELRRVSVTSGGDDEDFYAVALQRTIRTDVTASAAFDVILIDDPSNPRDFIIATGWTNPGLDTDPPTSVSGNFASPTGTSIVNAHLFTIDGSTITSWRATEGTASFTSGTSSGTCSTVENGPGVTCQHAEMSATFNVVTAMPVTPGISTTRSASLAAVTVGGIIIRMVIE